jgi:peptidoglycan/LPS O-acetylase OafA/YrhL
VIALWLHVHGVFGHDWWRYYFLVQNYSARTAGGGLALAWTLCVEVSFYLLLPFYAASLARASRGRSRKTRIRLELAVLAVLGLASLGLYYASRAGDLSTTLYLTLPTTFLWFALGMALAVVSVGPVAPRIVAFVRAHPGWCWLAAGALYVVMSFALRSYRFYSADQWTFQFVVSALVAIALVAPAALGHDAGGWPRRLLASRPLALLGLVSYGIYLWQTAWIAQLSRWGVDGFVGLLAGAVALTIAVAAISYVFLERPLMRFKNPRRATEPPATRDTAAAPVSGRAPVPDTAPGSRR